jgi:hypothetical protein
VCSPMALIWPIGRGDAGGALELAPQLVVFCACPRPEALPDVWFLTTATTTHRRSGASSHAPIVAVDKLDSR